MSALADYVTPITVDHFGSYPGKKPGDRFETMYHGKVYVVEVLHVPARKHPDGSIFRDARFMQVEGPVSRMFAHCPIIARAVDIVAGTKNKKG